MKQRTVRNSNVKVSLLGLGCNNFGLRMPVEDSQAVIGKALDLGITFFDTADVYGKRGGSETALGRYLGARLNDVFIASKFGNAMDEEGKLRDESVERQLNMLGSEVVRVADHFRVEESPDHATECQKASERIAAAA